MKSEAQPDLFWFGICKQGRYVERITYEQTKPFILGIHYARRMPNVQYAYGLFDDGKIVGIVTYGQPASPSLCKGIAGEENRHNVLELNRLVVLPEYNGKNNASFLVGNSLKMLPNHTFVVSYADWGGVATRWICVSGYQLLLHRHDQKTDGYCKQIRTFKALQGW